MALTMASLKSKIIAEMNTQFGAPADATQLAKFAEAIATAVVSEITSNAIVNSGITVLTPDTINGTTTGTGTIS